MACLDEDTLAAFVDGRLSLTEIEGVDEHLDRCPACRALATEVVTSAPARDDDGQCLVGFLPSGAHIGRFVVIDCLGVGASGVVCSAYDRQLDRKVAVKLLRAGALGTDDAARLMMHEAQAMARLSHPNVVAVYEAGSCRGRVFIAMELVDGCSLREWCVVRRPSWREILDLFVQAGAGLAAAHAANVVHRDFKPDNVLVDGNGRVRVTDFGLAAALRAASPHVTSAAEASAGAPHGGASGIVLGTPCYMAPEQMVAETVDARADQFSFCAALYEAWYGERPFAGQTLPQLRAEIEAGRLRKRPRRSRVPAALHAVLRRGLAASPEDRFQSMNALLTALAGQRRVRWPWMAVAVVLLLALPGLWGYRHMVSSPAARCQVAAARMGGIWNEEQRQKAHQAFSATAKPYAEDAWRTADRALASFQATWTSMRAEVCVDTLSSPEPGAGIDLQMACLHRCLQEGKALVTLLAAADELAVENAARAVRSLCTRKSCAAVAMSRADNLHVTAQARPRSEELTEALAAAKALSGIGKYAQAQEALEALTAETRALGDASAEAEVLLTLGLTQSHLGKNDQAANTIRHAALAAELGGAEELAARAYTALGDLLGSLLGRPDEGMAWFEQAAAKLKRLGGDEELSGTLHASRAWVMGDGLGQYGKALEEALEGLRLTEKALGSDAPECAYAHETIGRMLNELGRAEEAIAHHERARVILTKVLGPVHPEIGVVLNGLGNHYQLKGDFERALELQRQAVAIYENAMGERDPNLMNIRCDFADVLIEQGRYEEAEEVMRRALASPGVNASPDPGLRPLLLEHLGEALRRQRRSRDAIAAFAEALDIRAKTLPPGHPGLLAPLLGLGEAYLGGGTPQKAVPPLLRALGLARGGSVSAGQRGRVELALAQVYRCASHDSSQVLILLAQARDHLKAAGGQFKASLDELEAWAKTLPSAASCGDSR